MAEFPKKIGESVLGQKSNAALQLFGFIPEPIRLENPVLQNGRVGVSLPVRSDVPDLPSKGFLKVQAYIHNRITLCSYQGGTRRAVKRLKHADLQALVKPEANIYILRKTRQELKIGSRWRSLPLETKWTSRAKNWVRDACSLIETEAGGVPLFLTLTCPGNTQKVFESFGIASGYIVDRFNRFLRYRVKEGWFSYVWEIQERGAPHLHYLFKMEAGSNFTDFYKSARRVWRQILLDVSSESGVDFFEDGQGGTHRDNPGLPVINFRKVKTSVAGYLAKYASKGRSKGGIKTPFRPGRWWGVSYTLRREVLARRVSYIFGATTIEAQTERLLEVVEKLGSLVKTVWRANGEQTGPGEFVSLVLCGVTPGDVASAIRDWLSGGDLEFFEKNQLIPDLVRGAPA